MRLIAASGVVLSPADIVEAVGSACVGLMDTRVYRRPFVSGRETNGSFWQLGTSLLLRWW